MLSISVADEQLLQLGELGWTIYHWGRRGEPVCLAAIRIWRDAVDVVILRGVGLVTAYRVPDAEPWNPDAVLWQYHGPAEDTLKAVLRLRPPGQPGAPVVRESPHPLCMLPPNLPSPLIVRPLSTRER